MFFVKHNSRSKSKQIPSKIYWTLCPYKTVHPKFPPCSIILFVGKEKYWHWKKEGKEKTVELRNRRKYRKQGIDLAALPPQDWSPLFPCSSFSLLSFNVNYSVNITRVKPKCRASIEFCIPWRDAYSPIQTLCQHKIDVSETSHCKKKLASVKRKGLTLTKNHQ